MMAYSWGRIRDHFMNEVVFMIDTYEQGLKKCRLAYG